MLFPHAFSGFCFFPRWDRQATTICCLLSFTWMWKDCEHPPPPLSCEWMVAKTSYPVEQALVEPFYYLTEWWLTYPTATMKQDHCLLTTFQPFLLSKFCWKEMCLPTSLHGKNQFPITCYQTYKFEGCEIPRKRILRVHAYMSNKNLPPNIWISLEFYSLPKWAGHQMTSNESEDDGDILYMPRWRSLVKKFSQIWL